MSKRCFPNTDYFFINYHENVDFFTHNVCTSFLFVLQKLRESGDFPALISTMWTEKVKNNCQINYLAVSILRTLLSRKVLPN